MTLREAASIAQIVTAVFAALIALFAFLLNEHVYDLQQKSLALQTVREFSSDTRAPGQKFGLACIHFVLNNIPEKDFAKWWGDHDPHFLDNKWRDPGDCIPPPYLELEKGPPNPDLLRSFSAEVYFQVSQTLNSYEIYLARIAGNIGYHSILCDELPVPKDQNDLAQIVRRVPDYKTRLPELASFIDKQKAYAICFPS